MADIRIRGAKAGQKQPRKPNISKDTAASISTAKLLYGLGEGEIYGLADGAKSIRLDGTPLVDDAGNPNFEGVTWDFRNGSNDQEYIKGFPDVSNETPVNVELRSSQPWIKAFNDTQISAVRVRLKWNRLSQTNGENGDVKGYKIDYAIDLQTDGGAYQTVLTTKIQDKTSAGYERTHRIDLPQAKTGWQLRVRRITPNSTSDLIQDTMMIDAVAEVIDVKLSYPNTALLGVQYNAELFNNIAKMSVRVKGKIIRVPDNYDPVARTYTGIWTGNFKDAYSNNPAWVFYDLCTQWRGGLGERLDATMIDRWSLYALGQYCDQQVSDGQGGLEPRFTCNVYLQKQEEAYTVLQNIAGIFRAMSFWTGERIMLDADVPQDSIYTYSSANIVGGVAGIQYSGTRNRDRHTLAKVAWDNPNNDYQTEYEYIRDEKAMSKFGVKVLDLSAFGCTSQAQAQRAGLWALKTEQLETRQVTFSVGLDGTIPRVGNIISLSDEAFAGRANGGRVSTVNGTQRIIELDREVTASVGDVLIINGGSGKSERRNISNVVGNRITVTAGFTSAEPEHVWAIETADLKLMRFRVMSITENDDATYAITAIQHEPQKYDAIDFGTDVKPTEITIVNPDTVDAPDTVNIESRHREVQGQTVTTLVISWAQVSGAVAYDVEWRKDDGTWIKLPRTGNVSAEIEGVYSGNYLARVRSVSAFDVQSQATTSILTEVKGKIGLPPTVVGLTATGVLFGMDLKWGFQAGSGDAAFTEIQVGSAPNVNVATLTQVSYPTNTHTVTGLQGNLKQSYRARLVDKLGFKSPWSAWVTGTTDASADKVMDLIQGQINESSLNQALTSKIEKIETNSSSISGINTEVDKAKADIIEANKVIAANKLEASNAVAEANTEITKAKADIAAADKVIAANKAEAANAVAAANKAIADNKLIASNAVAAANKEIAASKVIIDSNKAEIAASRTELNTAKTQLATAITDINTANTKIADSKLLIDANKAKLVLTDAEVAEAKTKVTALETDYNDNKTSVNNALIVLTDEDKSLASDLSALTASYGASEAKLVQDLKVLTDKDVALTNSVTTLSSSYEANKTKVATDITTLVNKDTALNNLLTTLDSDYKTNKASVSNSLTTLTNKDTSLASDISKLNTKTDNTNAEIATVKGLVSDNTSSIATTKTDITAAYKQAIEDIEIGGRNYFVQSYLSIRSNWINSTYLTQKDPLLLEPNTTYTFYIGQADITSGDTVLSFYGNNRPIYGQSVEGAVRLHNSYIYHSGVNGRQVKGFRRTFTTDDTGITWLYCYNPMGLTNSLKEVQIFKGTVLQDWSPAPEDIEADYNAKISTEATARADADRTITSSVTTLKSDYDANKASVTQSLGTLTDKDTALTNQLSDLTSTVGTNTANITDNHSTLVAEDKAIADSLTALDTKYEDNKTSVSNQLIALTNADTALGSRITTLDTDYKGNKTAIRNELTAVSDKANSTASNLTSLTTEVDKNKTAISTEATTRSTEDTALSNRITTVSGKTDNALSRISTAETTIANNTGAITQQKTDITAEYKQAIDDIEIGGRNLLLDSVFSETPEFYSIGRATNLVTNYNRFSFTTVTNVNSGFYLYFSRVLDIGSDYILTFDVLPDMDTSLNYMSIRKSYPATTKNLINVELLGGANTRVQVEIQSNEIDADYIWVGMNTRSSNVNFVFSNMKLEKGNKATDWSPAPEDIEADYNAKISTEATARADADTALTNLITTLDTDYKGNKTTVSNSLSALSDEDTALGNSITDLTAIVDTNTASISAEATARADADRTITSSVTALESDYDANKASVTNSLSTLTSKDTALTNSINALTTRVGTAEGTITSNNTALVNKDKALTDSLNALTTDYNGNKTTVSNSLSALSTADTALGNRITATDAIAKNAQSRVGTAETAISNATNAIAQQKTDITAAYTKAIDNIEIGGRNLLPSSINNIRDYAKGQWKAHSDMPIVLDRKTQQWVTIYFNHPDIVNDKEYVLSFSMRKVSGTITNIGGHSSPHSTGTITIDEANVNGSWAGGVPFPDDTEWHNVSVVITKARKDAFIYIQVDRGQGYKNESVIEVSRFKLEKGNKVTDWTPPPEDVTDYVDTSVSTLKTLVDSKASISRVDTVENNANQALATAKTELTGSYTSAIATAKTESATDAQTKATKALKDAKADTVLKANAAETAAKTYALAEAKAKADAALVTAKSDSTTKANAAESAAKLAAAADAKTKADKALADAKIDSKAKADEAERLAKAHADTKVTALTKIVDSKASISSVETVKNDASQALAAAKTALTSSYTEAINGIEIGGRNLIVSSSLLKGKYIVESTGNIAAAGTHTATDFIPVSPSSSYIFSELTVGIFQVRFAYYTSDKVKITGKLYSGAQGKSLIATTPSNAAYMRISGEHTATRSNVATWMFEKGNKATDWTPAPEDVEAAYTAAISTEATVRSSADTTLTNLITTLDTDYQGNKTAIRNELTAVSNKTNSTATSLGTLTTTVGNNTAKISQESTARSNADTALGNRITATDAIAKNAQSRVGTAETAISNATNAIATLRTDVTAEFDNLEIGGQNLLPNSDFSKGYTAWSNASDIAQVNVQGIGLYTTVTNTSETGAFGVYATDEYRTAKIYKDETYTLSWLGQGTFDNLNYIHLLSAKERNFRLPIVPLKNGRTNKYEITFEAPYTTDDLNILMGALDKPKDAWFQFSGLMLQKGNKATEWTPSPEDNKAAIQSEAIARADADTAIGKLVTAVTARTATAEGKITTLTQTTADNNTAIAQSKQVLEARFDNLLVGGENLVVDSMEEGFYRTYGNSTHIFSDKSDGYETRILRSNCSVANNNFGFTTRDRNISLVEGQEYTLSFHGQATFNNLNYIYIMRDDGSNFQLPPIVMGSGLRNRKVLTFTAPWSTEKGYLLLAARNYSAGSWFAIGGLMLQKGNSATEFVPNVSGTRALLAQESKATADKFGKMELEWTVKTDIGGRISGFGLMSSATQTDFAVNADKFYIAPPTGSSRGVSPFMVLTSPRTINGTSVPAGTYIESAFIHNGSIDTLQVKDGAITTAKIGNLQVDTAQIANGAIETAKIANLAVDTLQIAGQAISLPLSSFNANNVSLGSSWQTAATIDIPINFGECSIFFSCDFSGTLSAGTSANMSVRLLFRGVEEYASRPVAYISAPTSSQNFITSAVYSRQLTLTASGKLEIQVTGYRNISNRYLTVTLLKR